MSIENDDIRNKVKDIRNSLTTLQAQGASDASVAKEIDHALSRIARIEEFLGLDKFTA